MNYYQILGINEDASHEEIKTAYKNMIKAFHPDYYRGSDKNFAEEKTKELNEAYEVLKDPILKARYDQSLKSKQHNTDTGNTEPEDVHKYDDIYSQINDLVEAECSRTCYTSFTDDIYGALCTVAYKAVCEIYSKTHNACNYCAGWLREYMKAQGMPDNMLEEYLTAFGTVFLPERNSKNKAFTWDIEGLRGYELDISLMAHAVASFRSVGLDIGERIELLETRESLERLVAGDYDKFNILENAINELYRFYVEAYSKTDWKPVRETKQEDTTKHQTYYEQNKPESTGTAVSAKPESYTKGLLGAFLCALGGGVIWGVLYYFGYLSSLGGIITIALAGYGYKKFGNVDHLDTPRKIICLVITIVVSALAIYLSLGVGVYYDLSNMYYAGEVDYVPSQVDIWVNYLPYLLQTDSEFLNAYLLDIGKGLGLSAIYLLGWFFVE